MFGSLKEKQSQRRHNYDYAQDGQILFRENIFNTKKDLREAKICILYTEYEISKMGENHEFWKRVGIA